MKEAKSMYAISFDLKANDLKTHYGEPYYGAYDEIRQELESIGFQWAQGSLYLTKQSANGLATVYKAINMLSNIEWFKNSVREIRSFKVDDWSDFTAIIKEGEHCDR